MHFAFPPYMLRNSLQIEQLYLGAVLEPPLFFAGKRFPSLPVDWGAVD
jgi:hypothetical protein